MKKVHQSEPRGLPGTPLRHIKASVIVPGHMPAAVPMSRSTRKGRIRKGYEVRGPKAVIPTKVRWITPPAGTMRQRLAVLKSKLAHKFRSAINWAKGR
jgi:hypothetical protein